MEDILGASMSVGGADIINGDHFVSLKRWMNRRSDVRKYGDETLRTEIVMKRIFFAVVFIEHDTT